MEPQDRIGLVKLTKWAFEGIDLQPLRNQLLNQCMLNQGRDGALMDLSVIDQLLGNRALGLTWQDQALANQRVFRTNTRKSGRKKLLVLAHPSHMGGNTPVEFLLQGSDFDVVTFYPTFDGDLPGGLPAHDIAFSAVPTDCDDAPRVFARLRGMTRGAGAAVLNLPAARVSLERDTLQHIFPYVPGLRLPTTSRINREDLVRPLETGAESPLFDRIGPFPWVIRPVGSHAGAGLARLDDVNAALAYLANQGSAEFFLSEFINYATPQDGAFRKYRIVFVDGVAYPCHMAIAGQWDVWYLNAGMDACPEKRAEEAGFMDRFTQEFAARHRDRFEALCDGIGLDYFGIDCAEDMDGNLVVFEADNALIVHDMDPPDVFPYKRAHMQKVFAAFERMLLSRCGLEQVETPPQPARA